MRIPFACLLLLSATVLSQDANVSLRYRKFINQHIKAKMSADRCTEEMRSRKISETDSNKCKEVNTFILATTNHVKAICERAGEPYRGGMTKSLQPFHVVVCKLRNQVRLPRCEYSGRSDTRNIAIRCEQGFPVHYDRDIVVIRN